MSVDINSISGIPTLDFSEYITFNPTLIIIVLVVILVYYFLFSSLGNENTSASTIDNGNSGLKYLGIGLISLFLVLLLINGASYLFNIDIVTSIKDFFSKTPQIDFIIDKTKGGKDNKKNGKNNDSPVSEDGYIKQVYHIPGNKYTYDDAKALCQAYGNRLANYKEMKRAYDQGADWCSYGWSDDQLALFPTQYKRWEKLQKIKGHEHDCGRPGINGGYIENPNVRFGANCFGYKPSQTPEEAKIMTETPLYPRTIKEQEFEKKVEYWKNNLKDIIVAPFNSKNWNNNWRIV